MTTFAASFASSAFEESRRRVLDLVRRHGWNATSFQVLEPGLSYHFDDDACVAYVDTGRAWVVAGAPIAAEGRMREVALRFEAEARSRRRRVRFFGVEERFFSRVSLDRVRIGEQPVWDPAEWERSLRASKSLREQLRRSRAKGVRVRTLVSGELDDPAGIRARIERLIERWSHSRPMAPMGFLVAVVPFTFSNERRYFVAERDGAVVGFLAAVPIFARDGWLLEDLIRDPDAPNGTAELLVDAAMRALAEEGCRFATLGLAPLSGAEGWMRAARRLSHGLYDFRGLRDFKAKLRPQRWEPIYLAWHKGDDERLAIFDTLAAFAHEGLLRFGLGTLLRVPTVVIQALAVLLVPWTALLAGVDSERWFPAPWIHWSWVAFDVALCGGLLALASRWRPWLGEALAAAVTLDAALTWTQALTFNAPRITSRGESAVVALAVAAPTVAAALLWRAVRHRSRGKSVSASTPQAGRRQGGEGRA
ncbi:MAG TPA: DUF2156 domain-containing protein [Vulgatibacter sp.]